MNTPEITFHGGWRKVEPNGEQCRVCQDTILQSQYQCHVWTGADVNNPTPLEDTSLCGSCYNEWKSEWDEIEGVEL